MRTIKFTCEHNTFNVYEVFVNDKYYWVGDNNLNEFIIYSMENDLYYSRTLISDTNTSIRLDKLDDMIIYYLGDEEPNENDMIISVNDIDSYKNNNFITEVSEIVSDICDITNGHTLCLFNSKKSTTTYI